MRWRRIRPKLLLLLTFARQASTFLLPRVFKRDYWHLLALDQLSIAEAGNLEKEKVLELASKTGSGFEATPFERKQMKSYIELLTKENATLESAAAFHNDKFPRESLSATLCGRWRLIYTDAPDITSLSSQAGGFSELERIGQECSTDEIVNVITWKPSPWLRGKSDARSPFKRRDAANSPNVNGNILRQFFKPPSLPSGLTELVESDVIEQRVVLKARADPQLPARVQLFVAGIDFIPKRAFGQEINPDQQISLRGPMSGKIPFGAFDVLYLDSHMRVTKTYPQGHLAINVRDDFADE